MDAVEFVAQVAQRPEEVGPERFGSVSPRRQRVLGLGSYDTAWTWMHKLRRPMVRPDRDRLGGPGITVELDDTFVGGRARKGSRNRYENKVEVAIAVERRHPKGLGRVRMRRIDRDRRHDIFAFAADSISPGTILYTDATPCTET